MDVVAVMPNREQCYCLKDVDEGGSCEFANEVDAWGHRRSNKSFEGPVGSFFGDSDGELLKRAIEQTRSQEARDEILRERDVGVTQLGRIEHGTKYDEEEHWQQHGEDNSISIA